MSKDYDYEQLKKLLLSYKEEVREICSKAEKTFEQRKKDLEVLIAHKSEKDFVVRGGTGGASIPTLKECHGAFEQAQTDLFRVKKLYPELAQSNVQEQEPTSSVVLGGSSQGSPE